MNRTPRVDWNAINEGLDMIVETLSGLRAKLIKAGFSDDAAEAVAIEFYRYQLAGAAKKSEGQ